VGFALARLGKDGPGLGDVGRHAPIVPQDAAVAQPDPAFARSR
jgi:hypothetical protein